MRRLRPDQIDELKSRLLAVVIGVGLAFVLTYCGWKV